MPDEANATQQTSQENPSANKQPSPAKKQAAKKGSKRKKHPKKGSKAKQSGTTTKSAIAQAKYPRYAVGKALRIPKAILEQNAGKECSDSDAAGFLGLVLTGPVQVEINAALKYGFLERPSPGRLRLTDLGRKVLRPQEAKDVIEGFRAAVLNAPEISDVYNHYRGENLPDEQFFDNALADNFHLPQAKLSEFKTIFLETLQQAELLEEHHGKHRVLDVSQGTTSTGVSSETLKKLGKTVSISADDTCFVVMPFAPPLGNHYSLIYEPAIKKAGMKPVRADDDIFATGKIMDQVWAGINTAKVLVAELTSRNPNVFYELGLAHALKKPVVLISSNENDVPFDVRHIRVIYYDVNDPFWGEKLTAKVAENILSAIKNPEEAIFKSSTESE
jgi:hypothetical protein